MQRRGRARAVLLSLAILSIASPLGCRRADRREGAAGAPSGAGVGPASASTASAVPSDTPRLAFEDAVARTSIARFSPDGRALAWNAGSSAVVVSPDPKPTVRSLEGHGDDVLGLAWSADGKRLATGSKDRTVKIWDATNGAELRTLRGFAQGVFSVAFDGRGARVAASSMDGVRVFDLSTGELVGRPLLSRPAGKEGVFVLSVSLSADGTHVAWAEERDQTHQPIELADLATGKVVELAGSSGSCAFSADGKTIVTTTFGERPRLYDVATGRPSPREIAFAKRAPFRVSLEPPGERLVTFTAGEGVTIYSMLTGALVVHHQTERRVLDFRGGPSPLLATLDDAAVWLVRALDGRPLVRLVSGSSGMAAAVGASGEAEWLGGIPALAQCRAAGASVPMDRCRDRWVKEGLLAKAFGGADPAAPP